MLDQQAHEAAVREVIGHLVVKQPHDAQAGPCSQSRCLHLIAGQAGHDGGRVVPEPPVGPLGQEGDAGVCREC